MGLYDRDYYRDKPPPPASTATSSASAGPMELLPSVRSVTFWLLVLNIGIYILDHHLLNDEVLRLTSAGPVTTAPLIRGLGFFSITTAFENWQLWRLLSFQFLHGNFHHLFANMLGLFFFGPLVEEVLGSRKFLVFYLLCGLGGVAGYVLLWASNVYALPAWGALIGASAGIMGILIASARTAPNLTVLLFLVIPLKLRTIAILALAYGVYIIVVQGENVGGEAGHLGGAAVGALLIFFPSLLNWVDRVGKPNRSTTPLSQTPAAPRALTASEAAEVDRILAKVGIHGMSSLTEQEHATLARASQSSTP